MIVEVRERIPNSQKTEPVNSMADASLVAYIGLMITILAVGVALGGLMLKFQHDTSGRIDTTNQRIDDTNKRIDELGIRFVELEKGQARLEGYLAGLQSHNAQPNA